MLPTRPPRNASSAPWLRQASSFPDAGMRLLTLSRDGIPDTLPDGVVAQPASAWMLGYGEAG